MKEIVSKSEFLKKYNEARKAAGIEEIDLNKEKNVGNNGYSIGQSFELDGTICTADVTDADNKVTGMYIALGTTNGTKLSLQSLMGLSSLNGYTLSGSATDSLGTTYTATAQVGTDFVGWEGLPTRDLYELAAMIEADPSIVKGKTATYKGVVIREFTAKKVAKDFVTGKTFKKGDKRVSATKLWEIA